MKNNIVPYSCSFSKRTLCKFCKKEPTVHYLSFENFCIKDFKKLREMISKYFKGNTPITIIYLFDPRTDLSMSSYSVVMPYSIDVRYHKNIKFPINADRFYEKIDVASCECGKTSWLYNISFPEFAKKVDVTCRKSNKKYNV